MKKYILLTEVIAINLLFSTTFISLAGEWQQNNTNWWYQEENGGYPVNTWKKLNGKWYYFNQDGYLVSDTWIGDYYLGSDGAWLQDIDFSRYIGEYTLENNLSIQSSDSLHLTIEKIESNKIYGYVSSGAGSGSGEASSLINGVDIYNNKFTILVNIDLPPYGTDRKEPFAIEFFFSEINGCCVIDSKVEGCIYETLSHYQGLLYKSGDM